VSGDGPLIGRQLGYSIDAAPEGAVAESCWAIDVAPAVVEITTEDDLVQAEVLNSDGSIRTPAVWRTETREKILSPRKILNFPTPCGVDLSPEFLRSLQRALAARGYYDGPVTGTLDHATAQAIRLYQLEDGLNSSFLSLESARKLGLIEIEHEAEPG